MKLTFITNAACIYEAEGFRIMADPWLSGTAFEGAWVHDPAIRAKPADFLDVDALYISHIHPDHCDPETLKHFRRDIPIITLRDKYSFCAKHLAKMGFTAVEALSDEQDWSLGPFELRMFGPFTKHPYHAEASELGNLVDSAILVGHGRHSILNTNDNTPSLKAARQFREEYGPPTIAQLNWNAAGPYPACFDNLSVPERIAESKRLVARGLKHMVEVGQELGAKFVQPFAGAYKIQGDHAYMNDYLGTCSALVASAYLEGNGIKPIHMTEGDSLDLDDLV